MIKEITLYEFDAFALNHPLRSYHQTSSYALLIKGKGYTYEFIGYFDETNTLKAATMIVFRKIDFMSHYGYAPKGFLLDFYDEKLVENFTKALKEYYKKSEKNIVFIKINPEIAIGEVIEEANYKVKYNQNIKIVETLPKYGYVQCNPKYNFETRLPKFNAVVNLKNFDINSISKNTRNKVNKGERHGLYLERTNQDGIEVLYKYVRDKKKGNKKYYLAYYNNFEKNNNVDLFLVKVNYTDLLVKAQQRYQEQTEICNYYNTLLGQENKKRIFNAKIESDKVLQEIKNDIIFATEKIKISNEEYIAAALIIKYANRIYFTRTGFDSHYKQLNPNHFLYYKIMEYYKNDYGYADLNGITGDIDNKRYAGLNQFKLGFNPKVYEFIGEFDLVFNLKKYKKLEENGFIKEEFYSENKKTILAEKALQKEKGS